MDEEELLRLGYPIQGSIYGAGKELFNSPVLLEALKVIRDRNIASPGYGGKLAGLLPYILPQGPGMWGSNTGGIMGIPQEQPSNFEEAIKMGMIPDTEWDQGGPVSVERPGYSRQSPASAGSRMRFTPPMRRIRGY